MACFRIQTPPNWVGFSVWFPFQGPSIKKLPFKKIYPQMSSLTIVVGSFNGKYPPKKETNVLPRIFGSHPADPGVAQVSHLLKTRVKVSKGQSQPELVAAAFFTWYTRVLGDTGFSLCLQRQAPRQEGGAVSEDAAFWEAGARRRCPQRSLPFAEMNSLSFSPVGFEGNLWRESTEGIYGGNLWRESITTGHMLIFSRGLKQREETQRGWVALLLCFWDRGPYREPLKGAC